MTVESEEHTEQDVVVLTPIGELFTAQVIQEIQALTDPRPTKHVVLDLRAIRSLVSGSLYPQVEPLTPLLNLNQHLQQERRRLVLCNIGSEIAEVFRVTRLDKIFEIQPDLAAALATLQQI